MPQFPYTFKGFVVPVFTPFHNDSERTLNLSIIPRYANYLSENKINGVLINGTSGEGPSMSVSERKQVARAWADIVQSTQQHLMIQVGGAPLPDVLELARHAEEVKADALLCLPDLYFKPNTVEQLIDYLKLVSDAAPNTPLLYYHIPMFSNVNIHMGQFLQAIGEQVATFVGIKFTSTNLEEGAQALFADNGKYVIYLGSDQIMSAGCALGMDSFIATSVNMFPRNARQILETASTGDFNTAKEKQQILSKAVTAISRHGHWVETMKFAMSYLTGIDVGPPRAPLKTIPSESGKIMTRDLDALLSTEELM